MEELSEEVLNEYKTRMTIYEDIIRIADLFSLNQFERPK
jgi:hypothetical protein